MSNPTTEPKGYDLTPARTAANREIFQAVAGDGRVVKILDAASWTQTTSDALATSPDPAGYKNVCDTQARFLHSDLKCTKFVNL